MHINCPEHSTQKQRHGECERIREIEARMQRSNIHLARILEERINNG